MNDKQLFVVCARNVENEYPLDLGLHAVHGEFPKTIMFYDQLYLTNGPSRTPIHLFFHEVSTFLFITFFFLSKFNFCTVDVLLLVILLILLS